MKKLIRSLWLVFVFNILTINQIGAATLHAILVGDTIGGEGEFQSNIDYMKHEVKRIAALTDLKLNALSFTGYQVRIKNILDHVSELNIQPDDVVILYFGLHGSRTREKQNPWPDLSFAIDIGLLGDKGYLDFNDIHEKVKNMHPRFLLSLADSCNSYRDGKIVDDEDQEKSLNSQEKAQVFSMPTPSCKQIKLSKSKIKFIQAITDEEVIEAYRHLFLNQRGSIIISSSSPGETATKYPIIGGIFTIQFLTALHRMVNYGDILYEKDKEISWQFILEQASKETRQELSIRGQEDIQTPQYQMDLNASF